MTKIIIEKHVATFLVETVFSTTIVTLWLFLTLFGIWGSVILAVILIPLIFWAWHISGAHFSPSVLTADAINANSSMYYKYTEDTWVNSLVKNFIIWIIMNLGVIGGGVLGVLIFLGLTGIPVPPAFIWTAPTAVQAWFGEMLAQLVITAVYLGVTDVVYAHKSTMTMLEKGHSRNTSYINDYYGLAIGIIYAGITLASVSITGGSTVATIPFVLNIMNAIWTGTGGPVGTAFFFLSAGVTGGLLGGFIYWVYRWLRNASYRDTSFFVRDVKPTKKVDF